MSRKWFLVLPLLVVCLLLFQNWLVFKSLQWTLQKTLEESFGGKLEWQSLEHKGATVVMHGPKIVKGEETPFLADELTIHWDIQLLNRTLMVEAELTKPECKLTCREFDLFQQSKKGNLSLFKLRGGLKIHDGKIDLPSGPAQLSLNLAYLEEKKIDLFLKQGEATFALVSDVGYREGVPELEGRMAAHHFPIAILSDLIETLAPSVIDTRALKGKVNGHFAFHLSPQFRPQVEGHLELYDLTLNGMRKNYGLEINHLAIQLEAISPVVKNNLYPWLPALEGKIVLSETSLGNKVAWGKMSARPLIAEKLTGTLLFHKEDKAEFHLSGLEDYEGEKGSLVAVGQFDYQNFEKMAFELSYLSQPATRPLTSLRLQGEGLGTAVGHVKMAVQNFGMQQFSLMDAALRKLAPGFNPIEFLEGRVDATLEATLLDQQLGPVSIDQLAIHHLACRAREWDSDFGAETLSGHVKLDLLAENPTSTLDAELRILNGYLGLETPPVELWKFSDIQTNLVIQKGVVQKSEASVNLAGLKGNAQIDWQWDANPLHMHFEGTGRDLAKFMPMRVQAGIERQSLDDTIRLDLSMQKDARAMHFVGDWRVESLAASHDFTFGFDLEAPDKSFKLTHNEFLFWFDKAPVWLPDLLGPYRGAIVDALLAKMQGEVGIFGFRLRDGWIRGSRVPLEKFVSPFLFRHDDIRLKGLGDFKAQFDLKGLAITYTGEQVELESDKVKMTMKEVPGKRRGELLGEHYVNFTTGEQRGALPIEQATYFDKVKGLLFTDIHGEAVFDQRKVFLPHISSTLNQVEMKGNILIDNTDEREGYFDVFVDLDVVEGSLKEAAEILEQIEPAIQVSQIPLDGQLHFKEKGAQFAFRVVEGRLSWDAKVEGHVSEGSLNLELPLVATKDIHFDFHFDKEQDTILVKGLSGAFFIGEAGAEEEYPFFVDLMGFNKLATKDGLFNIQVFDRQGELFRVAGITEAKEEHVLFKFDKVLTHFGDMRPSNLELKMKGLSAIENFNLDLSFDLKKIFNELARIARSGLSLSPKLLSSLEAFEGKLEGHFHYQASEGRFLYQLQGKKVKVKGKELEQVALLGDYQEGVWRIKDGQIDALYFSLDATKKKGTWLLEHLGIKLGNSLVLGLEGEWEEGASSFLGRVNLLEVALEKLDEFAELRPFVEEFNPKGLLKGSGTLNLGKNEKGEPLIEASFTTRCKDIQIKGLHFQDIEPSTFQFVMGQGVQLRNLKTALLTSDTHLPIVDLFVEKVGIDFHHDITEIENLKFALPAVNLPWLSQTLEASFPDLMTPFVKTNLTELKKGGIAQGAFHLKFQEGGQEIKVTLADGPWQLLGWDQELKNFLLELDNEEIKISTQVVVDNRLAWVISRTPYPEALKGVIVISDGMKEDDPLTIYWEKKEEQGLVINKVAGRALGVSVAIEEDTTNPTTKEAFHLKGEMNLDLARAAHLLGPELREKLMAMELGRGWGLTGHLQVEKEMKNEVRPYHFLGHLYGRQCEVKGYCFEELFANVEAHEDTLVFSDFQVKDPALALFIKYGAFRRNTYGQWVANIPFIEASHIRPSLLWEIKKTRSSEPKPLVIDSLTVQDLNGPTSNLRGTGQLTFQNPVKKNLHNTIFALPAEILSRIGIDLIALTPVSGTIQFHIQNGAVVFTKFKDVYSDGKLSKFNLAGGRTPSYMEFDGSLHLHIRMKQYTLLFKLAELFTFDIGGTLSKPVYSVHKGGS